MPRSATQQAQTIGRLKVKLQKAEAVVEAIRREIKEEEAVLLLMRPGANLDNIPPRPSRKMDTVPKGYWAEQTLDIVREAAGTGMTVFEIADKILHNRGIDPASEPLVRDYGVQNVRSALKRRKGVYVDHDDSKPPKWWLI